MKHPERGTRRHRWIMTALVLGMIPLAGTMAAREEPVTLKLVSEAFAEGGAIPRKYTCQGQDVSRP